MTSLNWKQYWMTLSIQPSDQGMHVVVWLGAYANDIKVAADAAAMGIAVRPTSPMYASEHGRSGLILGFGGFTESQIEMALEKLCRLLRQYKCADKTWPET